MRKTLIALAVLGAAAGVAHAQSNVTIYGVADTGYVWQSGQNGAQMNSNASSRLGFRGTEDLGSGMRAFFNLEERFDLHNGQPGRHGSRASGTGGTAGGDRLEGLSNVGLGGTWGQVSLGRVFQVSTQYFKSLDPFDLDGIGSGFRSSQRTRSISNTLRYDSPNMSGFQAHATWTRGGRGGGSTTPGYAATGSYAAQPDVGNEGYALQLRYAYDALQVLGGFEKVANSNDSYTWNLGGAYQAGPARITLGYMYTRDKINAFSTPSVTHYIGQRLPGDDKAHHVILGLAYKLGSGTLNASYNYARLKNNTPGLGGLHTAKTTDSEDLHKIALGYTYDLSKRTALYANIAWVKYENSDLGAFYRGGRDKSNAYGTQIGITHRF